MNTTIKLLVTTTIVAHATIGLADPNDAADTAFKRGQAAFKAGRIHEACEAYEASEQLVASIDTELGLAACYEQDGKPMSAARLYRGVADKASEPERRKTSSAKAAKLEARAPRLRFAINPQPPGLVIEVDGVEVSTTDDVRVDTGPHEVVATAPGFEGHASAPVDRERAIVDVILRMEPHEQAAPPPQRPAPLPAPAAASPAAPEPAVSPRVTPASPETTDREPTVDHRRRNGLIAGGVGVGVLIGAGVLFAASSNKFDDEHALCPNSRCANDGDLATAKSLLSDARTLRGTSIGMAIGGGLLLIAGTYLVVTPRAHEARVSFHVDHHGAGVAYTAHF
jgi:hypothetical protein